MSASFGLGVSLTVAASMATSAAGSIVNGSFENNAAPSFGAITGWTITAPGGDETNAFLETAGGDMFFFTAAPTNGTQLLAVIAASNAFSPVNPNPPLALRQDLTISAPTLRLDYQAGWLQESTSTARRFDVVIRSLVDNSVVLSSNVLTIPGGESLGTTGVETASIDVSALQGGNYRLSLEFSYASAGSGLAIFGVDNVRLVPGPMSAGPLALAGLVALRRRRRV